jgi:hypothetical protein
MTKYQVKLTFYLSLFTSSIIAGMLVIMVGFSSRELQHYKKGVLMVLS